MELALGCGDLFIVICRSYSFTFIHTAASPSPFLRVLNLNVCGKVTFSYIVRSSSVLTLIHFTTFGPSSQ